MSDNGLARSFRFQPGPLFHNLVLADEVNRASPKTQSALLEAMSEKTVSVDGVSHALPDPFFVVATQNPLEHHGTHPLPESQLDRFLMSLRIGYPPRADERELLLSGGVDHELETMQPVLGREELMALQRRTRQVTVAEKLADYMLALAEATRQGGDFLLGVSTRGVQSLYRAAQALALTEGRGFVVPDDVQRLAVPVLTHRVVLKRGGSDFEAARRAVERAVRSVPVPV
jgi:MoxR-like ATPase